MNKCFGIISYLPDNEIDRNKRINRFNNLLKQLGALWPSIDILIVAQNWKSYNPKTKNKLIRFDYPPLGIIKARHTLRDKFLGLQYDYIIMFDDDCIIKCMSSDAPIEYMKLLESHPNGFCFIKVNNVNDILGNVDTQYKASQLNLCAISKYIYEKESIPDLDVNKSEGFEDAVFSYLLHYKYANLEFEAPKTITHIHFKNPEINKYGGEVSSTWSRSCPHNWQALRANTEKICQYIKEHKELPPQLLEKK